MPDITPLGSFPSESLPRLQLESHRRLLESLAGRLMLLADDLEQETIGPMRAANLTRSIARELAGCIAPAPSLDPPTPSQADVPKADPSILPGSPPIIHRDAMREVCNIAMTADDGCSHCAAALLRSLHAAFPGFDDVIDDAWRNSQGVGGDWRGA